MEIVNSEDVSPIEDVCGEIRELYNSDNLSMSLAIITGKAGSHKHEKMEEVYYVVSGYGKITIGGEVREIKTGDMISIPKGVYHHAENMGEEPLKLIVVTHPKYDTSDVISEERKSL